MTAGDAMTSGARPAGTASEASAGPVAQDIKPAWVREALRCPVCHGELVDAQLSGGGLELRCAAPCDAPGDEAGVRRAYRVEDGIPVLLPAEARLMPADPR